MKCVLVHQRLLNNRHRLTKVMLDTNLTKIDQFGYTNNMPRTGLTYLFVFFLLFNGLEGVIESAQARHVHESGNAVDLQGSEQHQLDDSGDHYTHCCHAHAVTMENQLDKMDVSTVEQPFLIQPDHLKNYAQGPPTPPPNV